MQRYSFLLDELPFYNLETLDELMMSRIMFVAGGKLCMNYPRIMDEGMNECKLDYHRSINSSIVEHEFLINKEVRDRVTALNIFPVRKKRALGPR